VPLDHPNRLRVLWVATKAPLPATDGGRLVMGATIEALAEAEVGVDVTLVAPRAGASEARGPSGVRTIVVETQPRSWISACGHSLRSGRPMSVERHANAAVAARVADLLRRESFDLVHVEQPQALSGAAPAWQAGMPCVLRAQNVESAVWDAAAQRRGLTAPLFRAEARRMRRFEAAALATAHVTIALSHADAAQLAALNRSARVVVVPPPAASPSMEATTRVIGGDPPFAWIGSGGWSPNQEALRWLVGGIWPAVSARVPRAHLHVFGAPPGRDATITWHDAPRDSGDAFGAGTILLLPLRIAAGVRMRLLEAWARGIPVIASPAAVEGLDTCDGRNVLLASDAFGFGEAGARLATSPDLRARLVQGGRATLARWHDPAEVAQATLAVYREAISAARAAR